MGAGLTNETYAKLKYLVNASPTDSIIDESGKSVSVLQYRESFKAQYNSSLEETLQSIDALISSNKNKEESDEISFKPTNPTGTNIRYRTLIKKTE